MSKKKEKDPKEVPVKVKPALKEEDIQAAKNFLESVGGVFGMQANMVKDSLKKQGCDISPSIYYPEKGDSIYMGLKLKLQSEEAAKYFYRCFEEANKRLSKK